MHPTATPVAQPQPQPASLHQPITQFAKYLAPTKPTHRAVQGTTSDTSVYSPCATDDAHPSICTGRREEETRVPLAALRTGSGYATDRITPRYATLRCAPADPAVTRTRRGDVAGWPCLAAALCIREYEREYGGRLWVHVLRRWVPRMCERVKGGGECLVTKAGRTFVRRGNTITGWGFAELGGTCYALGLCVVERLRGMVVFGRFLSVGCQLVRYTCEEDFAVLGARVS
jgi:hypothetical protein